MKSIKNSFCTKYTNYQNNQLHQRSFSISSLTAIMRPSRQLRINREHAILRYSIQQRNRHHVNWQKLKTWINLLASVVCLVICLWQVSTSINKYFDGEKGTKVRIEKYSPFTFPVIYLCPISWIYDIQESFLKLCYKYNENEMCRNSNTYQTDLETLNISLNDLFDHFIPDKVETDYKCDFATNEGVCRSIFAAEFRNDSKRFLDTITGRCLTVNTTGITWDLNQRLRNMWTITVKRNAPGKIQTTLLHMSNEFYNNKYLTALELFDENTTINIDITRIQEYQRVKPCIEDIKYIECKNKCFDQLIYESLKKKTSVNGKDKFKLCKIPLLNMSDKYENCRSKKELMAVFTRMSKVVVSKSKCPCAKRCRKIMYHIITSSQKDFNGLNLKIRQAVTFRDVVEEYYVYKFSSLLSDSAGNIGFYIGISLLGVLNLISSSFLSLIDRKIQEN